MADELMPTIREQGDKATIESVKAEAPSQFRVGATWDGKTAVGGISYDRKWSNLWGATAYAKAYWNDAPIVPTDKFGFVVGVDAVRKFEK